MSKIKLSQLHQDNLEIQNLSNQDCHNIVGGMEESTGSGETNSYVSVICKYFPHLEICNEDPGTIQLPEPYIP